MQYKMRPIKKYSGLLFTFSFLISIASCNNKFRVSMPNVIPTEDDNYLCIAYPVSKLVPNDGSPIYITKFEADSDANKAHHIILQSCKSVGVDDATIKPWDCRHHQTCQVSQFKTNKFTTTNYATFLSLTAWVFYDNKFLIVSKDKTYVWN